MTSKNMTKAHCHGKTTTGKPCRMAPLKGSVYCFNHDPSSRLEQAKARRAGGLARHTPHAGDPKTIPAEIWNLAGANSILSYTLQELLIMDNSIPRARALLDLFDRHVKSFEIGELEARIAALEAMKK